MYALKLSGPTRFILYNRMMKIMNCRMANNCKRARSTVNMKDIEQHNKIKDKWWDSQTNLLISFNPIRIQFVREGLANVGFKEQTPSLPLQGVKIVDVGCGGGILSEGLARIGAQVTGIDASKELIDVAKQHIMLSPDISHRVNYIYTTVEEFSSTNEKQYDVVVSSEVVEHVENYKFFLQECVKLLKPNGSIFITTPNKTFMSWLGVIILPEYILNALPRGTHDWNKFIHCQELQHTLENYGCTTILTHGIRFNPLTRQWFFTSNTQLMYALHAIKNKNI